MNRKLVTSCIAVMAVLSAWAQKYEGINFIPTQPFEQVRKTAAEQKKNIFVDCFATWCGPCKLMAKETFPQRAVGDYVNSHFISIQYDVEKGPGIEFYKNYGKNIPGLPTILIIDPTGKVLHSVVGFRDGQNLISDIKKGMQGKSLHELQERYEAGERGIPFMKDYLEALDNAYKKKEMKQVTAEFVADLPVDAMLDQDIWGMVKDYITDPYSGAYRYVINNAYKVKYSIKENYAMFDRQLTRGMDRAVKKLLPTLEKPDVSHAALDSMNMLNELLEKNELSNSHDCMAKIEMARLIRQDKPQELLSYLGFAKSINLFRWDKTYLKHTYEYLSDKLTDKNKIKQCLDNLYELQESENAISMPTNFYGLIAKLNAKLNRQEQAADAENKYQRLEKINQAKAKKFYELFQ